MSSLPAGAWEVPAGSRYFEGHFPGSPILPGAALLQMVLQRVCTDSSPAGGVELARVRFLRPVRPGMRLGLVVRDREGVADIAVRALDADPPATVGDVASLTVRALASAPDVPAARLRPEGVTIAQAPADLLPHAGPALLLHQILARQGFELEARAHVPSSSAFAGPWASAATVEVAAQAAAAHAAGTGPCDRAVTAPVAGQLVGIKGAWLAARLRLDGELRVHVRRAGGSGPLAIYAASCTDASGPLLRGDLSVWSVPAARR